MAQVADGGGAIGGRTSILAVLLDEREQILGDKGLGEVVIHANVEATLHVARHGVGSDTDDRHMTTLGGFP